MRIIALVEALPPKDTGQVIGKQILRSGTSVGANYRAACRAKSTADILHKLSIVEEEAFPFWIGDFGFWINKAIGLAPKSKTQIDDARYFYPTIRLRKSNPNPKSKI